MKRNEVVLDGRLIKRGVLRYTPAGKPALDLRIGHRSMQSEAGGACEARCEIEAVVLGELAVRLSTLRPNAALQVQGFIAQRGIGRRNPVLHVIEARLPGGGGDEQDRTQGD